jgi:hypothetical protein
MKTAAAKIILGWTIGGKWRLNSAMNASIEEEMLKLPNLKHIGLALVQFVCSLENGKFIKKETDWVFDPSRFVAFGFPKRGGEQIRMQFR